MGDERASFDNVGVGIHFASINGVIFQNHDALLSWEYYAPLVNPRLTRTYAGDWTSCSKNCQGKNSPPCSCLTKTLLLIAKSVPRIEMHPSSRSADNSTGTMRPPTDSSQKAQAKNVQHALQLHVKYCLNS